jgi:hypothetical protein
MTYSPHTSNDFDKDSGNLNDHRRLLLLHGPAPDGGDRVNILLLF